MNVERGALVTDRRIGGYCYFRLSCVILNPPLGQECLGGVVDRCHKSAVPPIVDSAPPETVADTALDTARDVLRRTFGHADFRGLQAGVIGELLAGRSAMAVLPTGGGKSLCYQIPA
jgi:hypothetical protein